ncbi:hypothetical protein QTL94_23625 [Rhizobium sp. S96]|nr:hypothetical protein [Rhizobium sp. S96]MDM9623332.1 hypothetical protein [Rhizobium sp. S96]
MIGRRVPHTLRSAPQRRSGPRTGVPAVRAHEERPRREADGRQRLIDPSILSSRSPASAGLFYWTRTDCWQRASVKRTSASPILMPSINSVL